MFIWLAWYLLLLFFIYYVTNDFAGSLGRGHIIVLLESGLDSNIIALFAGFYLIR